MKIFKCVWNVRVNDSPILSGDIDVPVWFQSFTDVIYRQIINQPRSVYAFKKYSDKHSPNVKGFGPSPQYRLKIARFVLWMVLLKLVILFLWFNVTFIFYVYSVTDVDNRCKKYVKIIPSCILTNRMLAEWSCYIPLCKKWKIVCSIQTCRPQIIPSSLSNISYCFLCEDYNLVVFVIDEQDIFTIGLFYFQMIQCIRNYILYFCWRYHMFRFYCIRIHPKPIIVKHDLDFLNACSRWRYITVIRNFFKLAFYNIRINLSIWRSWVWLSFSGLALAMQINKLKCFLLAFSSVVSCFPNSKNYFIYVEKHDSKHDTHK